MVYRAINSRGRVKTGINLVLQNFNFGVNGFALIYPGYEACETRSHYGKQFEQRSGHFPAGGLAEPGDGALFYRDVAAGAGRASGAGHERGDLSGLRGSGSAGFAVCEPQTPWENLCAGGAEFSGKRGAGGGGAVQAA